MPKPDFKQTEKMYREHGIIGTAKFSGWQSERLIKMLEEEGIKARGLYESDQQAALAAHLVELDQMIKKVKYHTE